MINKREYKTPLAEITEFECADVITASNDLIKAPKSGVTDGKTYVRVGASSWVDGFGNN